MRNNRQILHWLWKTSKPFRLQACLNATLDVFRVGLDFAFITATKMAIDTAMDTKQGSLQLIAAMLIGIILSQITVGFGKKWISALLGVKAQNRMQHNLFQRLLNSEWQGVSERHSGDTLNRLERDVTDITNVITETVPAAMAVFVRLIAAFFYLYSMDHRLAFIVVVIAPVFALLSRIYVKKMRSITRQIRQTDSQIQSLLTESVQHHTVLKTLERTHTMSCRLATLQEGLRRQVQRRTVFASVSNALMNTGFHAGYLITFLWGVSRLQDGTITYGMMIAFIQLVGQIQWPIREMTRFVPVIVNSLTASERLIELEQTPLEEQGEPIRLDNPVGIRINDVCYSYDASQRTVLSHLSHDFTPGTTTAILGETGAGKTTLLRLILALMKPQSGSVEFYSTSPNAHIQRASASPLTRCNLVYVPQGNTLFSGTVRDNLLLGNPDATEKQMTSALQCACADFILQQPDGLDTLCGELGTGLSEGQAQRIAIARALLREGSILLLDEATSALDTDTEQRLLDNLTSRLDGRQTVLFITHRPAIVDHCTHVLRLERNQD